MHSTRNSTSTVLILYSSYEIVLSTVYYGTLNGISITGKYIYSTDHTEATSVVTKRTYQKQHQALARFAHTRLFLWNYESRSRDPV